MHLASETTLEAVSWSLRRASKWATDIADRCFSAFHSFSFFLTGVDIVARVLALKPRGPSKCSQPMKILYEMKHVSVILTYSFHSVSVVTE